MTPAAESREARASVPARETKSPAALVAVMLFAWGISLLAFDWLRREVFEPRHQSHLVLVVPFFGGAVAAAAAAVAARKLGRPSLGGAAVHHYAIASGLLGVLGASLLLWLGPRLEQAAGASRELRALRHVEQVIAALETHRRAHGYYPVGAGTTLEDVFDEDDVAAGVLDPWGRPLVYQALSEGRGYLLLSTGDDGVQDLPFGAYLDPRTRPLLTDDLVVVNGELLTSGWPDLGPAGAAEQPQDSHETHVHPGVP